MSSERHRTQTMNLEDAWEKLFEFVKESVQLPRIQGLGILNSEAQMERVYEPSVAVLMIVKSCKSQLCVNGRPSAVKKRKHERENSKEEA